MIIIRVISIIIIITFVMIIMLMIRLLLAQRVVGLLQVGVVAARGRVQRCLVAPIQMILRIVMKATIV